MELIEESHTGPELPELLEGTDVLVSGVESPRTLEGSMTLTESKALQSHETG